MVKTLASHPSGLGLIPRLVIYHMWVVLVVGSYPCSKRFFLCVLWFSTLLKRNISKFQFESEILSEGYGFISQ